MLWSIFAFITSLLCKGWNGKVKTHHLHQEFFHKFVSPVCFPSLVRHNKRNPSSHCFCCAFRTSSTDHYLYTRSPPTSHLPPPTSHLPPRPRSFFASPHFSPFSAFSPCKTSLRMMKAPCFLPKGCEMQLRHTLCGALSRKEAA